MHRGAQNKLSDTINKFIQWRKQKNLPPNKSRTFNIIHQNPDVAPEQEYWFEICCTIIKEINDADSGVTVNYLYSNWLPSSGFELRDYPLFFERITLFPEVPEHRMITDIYLPIV